MSVRVLFAWYDFWLGWYWDRAGRVLYVCPFPMLVVRIGLCARCEENTKGWRPLCTKGWRPLCEKHRANADTAKGGREESGQ